MVTNMFPTEFLNKTKQTIIKIPEFLYSTFLMVEQEIQLKFIPVLEKKSFDNVFLLGCGDSFILSEASKYTFKKYAKVPTFAENAFEFNNYESLITPSSLAIGFSAGGRTSATINALEKAKENGAFTIGVTNAPNTPIESVSDITLYTRVANPIGPPTATTVTALLVSNLIALYIGNANGAISSKAFVDLKTKLGGVSTKAKDIMNDKNKDANMAVAKYFATKDDVYVIGGGPLYATAMLTNAKIKEIAYAHSEAIEVEEFCHYGMIPVEPGMPVILFAHSGKSFDRIKEVAKTLSEIGTKNYIVTDKPQEFLNSAECIVEAPKSVIEEFAPIVDIIPIYFLTLHFSVNKGLKVTGFRYGDKLTKLIGYL